MSKHTVKYKSKHETPHSLIFVLFEQLARKDNQNHQTINFIDYSIFVRKRTKFLSKSVFTIQRSFRPRVGNLRPAKAFIPAHDLFLFSMIDMQQQTAEMILTLFLEFLAETLFVFILVFAINSTEKRPEFWRGPTFFFFVLYEFDQKKA